MTTTAHKNWLWSTAINYGVLLLWFLLFVVATTGFIDCTPVGSGSPPRPSMPSTTQAWPCTSSASCWLNLVPLAALHLA